MSELSTYKVIELIGTSPNGWEDAVQNVVSAAAKNIRDIRIVEVEQLDAKVIEGRIVVYRAKVKLSFKFHGNNE